MANNFVNVESVEVKYFDTLPVVVRKVQALGYDAETARRAALDIYSKGVGRRGAQVPWHGIGEFPANVVPVQALQSDIDARETYIEENLPPVEEVDDDNIKKIINAVTFTFSSNRTSRELFEAIQLSSTVPFACFKDRVRINSSSSFLAAAAFKQLPHGQCICSQKHIGASLNDNIRIKISRREPRYMFRGPSLNAEEFYAHAVIKVNSDSGTCDVLVRIETPAEKEWYSQSLREAIDAMLVEFPRIRAGQTDVKIGQEEIVTAQSFRRPQLGLSLRGGEERFRNASSNFALAKMGSVSLEASQLLFDGGSARNRIEEARALNRGTQIDLETTRQALALDLSQNYVDILKYSAVFQKLPFS